MEINEVTIFKLIIFMITIVLITIFCMKIYSSKIGIENYSCAGLLLKENVKSSYIDKECKNGFYPNYGKFNDVRKGEICCVSFNVI
jgi:hypothetical protein